MTSFEKFGESFQTKILYHLVTDRMFSLQIMDILDPDFFSNESYVEITNTIKEWNDKYNTIPSFDNLTTLIKTKKDDEVERDYLLELIKAISQGVDITDKQFVVDETVKFCKQQAMKNAILKSVDLLKREKYDEIYSVVQKALVAGESRNLGHSYVESALGRSTTKRNPIPTGFPLLDDEYIAGGLSSGELGIFLGGTGAGKSFLLAQMAYSAFMAGKTAFIYSFELSEINFGLRLDSKFSGIPLTRLLLDTEGKHREEVKNSIMKARGTINGEPEIIIKEYPTKGATLPMMKNHVLQWKAKGVKPDVIIVDYADLIKPTSRYKEKRFEVEAIVEELRGWARELEVPIWTASQTNRDGWDTSIVTLKTISEAAQKAMVADIIISIGRDQELTSHDMACYYLAKSRMGKDKISFVGRFNTSTMDFSIDEEGYDASMFGDERNNRLQGNMRNAVNNVLNRDGSPQTTNENLRYIIDLLGEE